MAGQWGAFSSIHKDQLKESTSKRVRLEYFEEDNPFFLISVEFSFLKNLNEPWWVLSSSWIGLNHLKYTTYKHSIISSHHHSSNFSNNAFVYGSASHLESSFFLPSDQIPTNNKRLLSTMPQISVVRMLPNSAGNINSRTLKAKLKRKIVVI